MNKKIIFVLFAIAGLLMSVFAYGETNISSVLLYHDREVFSTYTTSPLTKGVFIKGSLKAEYDRFGILKLRIHTYNRINTTHLTFKLWEKGSDALIANNTYATDRFTDGLLYSFGFPIVENSKGKIYEFELIGIDGTFENAVGIVDGYHNVASQYLFTRQSFTKFVSEKIKNTLSDPYAILFIVMFLAPAFSILIKSFKIPLYVFVLSVYTYLPVAMISNTLLLLFILIVGTVYFAKIPSSRLFQGALLWLLQLPVLLAVGNLLAADRAASIVFFLILSGCIIAITDRTKK